MATLTRIRDALAASHHRYRSLHSWRIGPLPADRWILGIDPVGTGLLKLPLSVDASLSWSEALFTATSAVTVTGLVVTDTGPTFSVWGEAVILVLNARNESMAP